MASRAFSFGINSDLKHEASGSFIFQVCKKILGQLFPSGFVNPLFSGMPFPNGCPTFPGSPFGPFKDYLRFVWSKEIRRV